MRLRFAVLCLSLTLLPSSAFSITQPYYFHFSTSGVAIPGGTTQYYMNSTAPTAGTPAVTSTFQVAANGGTVDLPTFTALSFPSATTLEKLVNVTVNVSANQVMTSCGGLNVTLYKVDSSGTATTLGTGVATGLTIPQGSGGGLQGYGAFLVSTDLSLDRTIPAGSTIRVKVTVVNSCNTNRSVRLVFDGTPATSRNEFTTPDVILYGAPGTFGSLTGTLTSGITLARSSVSTWAPDPGQQLFYSAISPTDGSLFVDNYMQTGGTFYPTECEEAVTCFNPVTKECPTDSGGTDYYSTIRFPNSSGALYTPSGPCNQVGSAGGADVVGIKNVQTPNGERIMFVSGLSSTYPTYYPAVGRLSKASGAWALEGPRYLADLASDPVGAQACTGGTCALMNEIAQLPGSGLILVAQYGGTSAGFSVMDTTGHLVANRLRTTSNTDAHNCGLGISTAPRSVTVDPTSLSSCGANGCADERFVISSDVFTTGNPSDVRSQIFQEFRIDSTTQPPTIGEVSAPLFATTAAYPSLPCATGAGNVQQVQALFDHQGNLWIVRNLITGGGQFNNVLSIYIKDPVTGKRKLETDPACAASGSLWGRDCVADDEVSGLPKGPQGMVEDVVTGTMIVPGFTGKIVRVNRSQTATGQPFTVASTVVDLALSLLPAAPVEPPSITVTHGVAVPTIDPVRRVMWVPIQSLESVTGTFFNPQFTVGALHRGAWIYVIDLDRVLSYP